VGRTQRKTYHEVRELSCHDEREKNISEITQRYRLQNQAPGEGGEGGENLGEHRRGGQQRRVYDGGKERGQKNVDKYSPRMGLTI